MWKKDVISYFGTQTALAQFLNIALPSITNWSDVIPEGRAYQLQVLTAGALRVDPALYPKPQRPAHGATAA